MGTGKAIKWQKEKCIKNFLKFCEICAHFFGGSCYNIHRKNPPIHYIVFATPQKKKYLLLKDSCNRLSFLLEGKSVDYIGVLR